MFTIQLKMNVEVKTSRSDWLNCSNIWLFCVENAKYSVSLKDCPAIAVNVRVAHVSPADKPLVRRRLLVAENSMTSISQTSPQLLIVTNSCNFKVTLHFM